MLRRLNLDYLTLLSVPIQNTVSLTSRVSNWIGRSKELEKAILRSSLDLGLVFLCTFILYSRSSQLLPTTHFLCHFLPTFLLLYLFYRFFFPRESRGPWLETLGIVLGSPFTQVTFRESFIGDVLTSIVRVVVPLTVSSVYIIFATYAFIFEGEIPTSESLWWQHHTVLQGYLIPLISLYPLWIRLVQCLRRLVETGKRWPHMGNAAKYSSALLVSSIGIFRPTTRSSTLWVLGFIFSTLFQFWWDIFMDWGLLKRSSQGSMFSYTLRSERVIKSERLYYFIALTNLCFRFAWSLTLMPEALIADDNLSSTLLAHLEPIVASIEIIRRMMWAILRVEWEHIETGGSRIDVNVDHGGFPTDLDKVSIHFPAYVLYCSIDGNSYIPWMAEVGHDRPAGRRQLVDLIQPYSGGVCIRWGSPVAHHANYKSPRILRLIDYYGFT